MTTVDSPAIWNGQWMAEHLGVTVDAAPGGVSVRDLVGVALRRNPKRAHLLVSTVLGKHVPADPRIVYGTARQLGALVSTRLRGATSLVLGYAETATALGHIVAEVSGSVYLHSTRRCVAGVMPLSGFDEEHSHASRHQLLPADPSLLDNDHVLVLVDDELSTGRTVMNTIAALHRLFPRQRYVVAALVDVRGDDDRNAMLDFAADLAADIEVVALTEGRVQVPDDIATAAQASIAEHPTPRADFAGVGVVERWDDWPQAVRDGGRHGFDASDVREIRRATRDCAVAVAAGGLGNRVLVLGTEELMYAPLLIANELTAVVRPGTRVLFSSSTRSPVVAIDEPGYPIRTQLAFAPHDDPLDASSRRYVYNVAGVDGGPSFTDIVLVVDGIGDTAALRAPDGLLAALAHTGARVQLVVIGGQQLDAAQPQLPEPLRSPGFGSYRSDEVAWLLTDLSGVALEAPIEDREEAIQTGTAHYAESLPIEYQPTDEYQQLFHDSLRDAAHQLAVAVGVLTEQLLLERGPRPVLASLARAGTPVGVLVRRWAQFAHGIDLAHYAVSIVRGRGIDTVALKYLAANHNPRDIVFVDGWTGKGAIARELADAVERANERLDTTFDASLAVLADPGSCVHTFGTRDDFLIPSACLNSTVSGLVSRTVLNTSVLAPGAFHGAKFYSGLAAADVSAVFVDAVSSMFSAVGENVERELQAMRHVDRRPTWAGWREVERLAEQFDIPDVNLIKPGVGETTRVLLRRIPWRVLVRRDALRDLSHLTLLAEQRGVEVVEVDELAFRSVGLIRPGYRRPAVQS